MNLNENQKMALLYYKAYGALCVTANIALPKKLLTELRVIRELLFLKYKQYDPDNSLDISKDYDVHS